MKQLALIALPSLLAGAARPSSGRSGAAGEPVRASSVLPAEAR
jgi:hypothetical protein